MLVGIALLTDGSFRGQVSYSWYVTLQCRPQNRPSLGYKSRPIVVFHIILNARSLLKFPADSSFYRCGLQPPLASSLRRCQCRLPWRACSPSCSSSQWPVRRRILRNSTMVSCEIVSFCIVHSLTLRRAMRLAMSVQLRPYLPVRTTWHHHQWQYESLKLAYTLTSQAFEGPT